MTKSKGVRRLFLQHDKDLDANPPSLDTSMTWSTRSSSMSSQETEMNNMSYRDLKTYLDEQKRERVLRKAKHLENALLLEDARQRSFDALMDVGRSNVPTQRQRSFHLDMNRKSSKHFQKFEAIEHPCDGPSFVQEAEHDDMPTLNLKPSVDKFVDLEGMCSPVCEQQEKLCNKDACGEYSKFEKLERIHNFSPSFRALDDDEQGTEVVLDAKSLSPPPPPRRRFSRLKLRRRRNRKKKTSSLKTLIMPLDGDPDRYAPKSVEEDVIEIIRRGSPPPDDDMDRYSLASEGEEDDLPLAGGLVRTSSKFRGDDDSFFTNEGSIASLADWSDDDSATPKARTSTKERSLSLDDKKIKSLNISWRSMDSSPARNKRNAVDNDWDLSLNGEPRSISSVVLDPEDIIALSRNDGSGTDSVWPYTCRPLNL